MTSARISRVWGTILLTITIFSLSLPAYAQYSGGRGEPNDPYQIATAEDLMLLGDSPEDYDKHFILTEDIDLDPNLPGCRVFDKAIIAPDTNEATWEFDGTPFTGVFDGNDRMISHMTITGQGYLGLFGYLRGDSEVKDIGIVDVNIAGSGRYVGGLVGRNESCPVIQSYSIGTVKGRTSVGGLVGENYYGSVVKCYANVSINTDHVSQMGGLIGTNRGAIENCYATGNIISGHSLVSLGGLVGFNGSDTVIRNCYANVDIGGGDNCSQIGGLIGISYANIINCYSAGRVVTGANASSIGGLIGATLWNCYDPIPTYEGSFWDIQASDQTTSAGGTGKTTTEMQTAQMFLDAGWDIVGERENGTSEIWQMPEGVGYPVLTIFSGYEPPRLQGSGTSKNPYLIHDASELGSIVHYSPFAHYQLADSIDLSGIRWDSAVIPWFAGTFDGNNLAISRLKITGGGYQGLFGQLASNADVMNLGVEDVDIAGSDKFIGGLVAYNLGSISNCHSTGTVAGYGYIGGLVGETRHIISKCYSRSVVTGTTEIGGLAGWNCGSISRCYSNSEVIGTKGTKGTNETCGGLAGWNCGSVSNCYSNGTVTGIAYIGGLVGFNVDGSISYSYGTGMVIGGYQVGGLVGIDVRGTITYSFWDTQTSGQVWSPAGTGKTTAEMQTASTFLEAGWDFMDETTNGIEDIWWIDEGRDYPRLWWELIPDEPLQIVLQ